MRPRLTLPQARGRAKSPQSVDELDQAGRNRLAVVMADIAAAVAEEPRLARVLGREAILASLRT